MIKRIFLILLILFIILYFSEIKTASTINENQKLASLDSYPSPTFKEIDFEIITETPIPSPTRKPAPTFTPTPIPFSSLDELFEKYSRSQSFSKETLKKVAYCESGYRTNARNGIYGGLFQFSESSWRSTRIDMNQNPDVNLRFDPEEAIKTAAFKMATQGIYAWPNCGKQ